MKNKITEITHEEADDPYIEDLDRAHHALTLLLIFKERIECGMLIGGLQCHIKAGYVNGKVAGVVSCPLKTKKFEFEYDSLKSLSKKNLIIAEIKRLYWDFYP